MTLRRIALRLAALGVGALLLIQLVPYGRSHANPPVLAEPAWDSAATRATAVKACFDCHSNETEWPWYSNLAPGSWILQRHVDEGREKLNFSQWGRQVNETDEIVEQVREGEMPPWDYTLLHPDARLTGAEREAFIAGLAATFGDEDGGAGRGGGDRDGGDDDDGRDDQGGGNGGGNGGG